LFSLSCMNWSWDSDLQIVHADVRLEVEGEVLIDEPLCVDVGMPALLFSATHDVEPDRWEAADVWERMPFFCCGCGDPECRSYSFRVHHLDGKVLQLTELEERQGMPPRELGSYNIPQDIYRSQVSQVAAAFLQVVADVDYQPYFKDTVKVLKELMVRNEMNPNHVSKMPQNP
jgi:hypothetical protein